MPESPQQFRFPILSPPRPTSVHDVASASDAGRRQRRNDDAVSVFALSMPQEEIDVVVLAVADGMGEHARGHGASGVAVEAFGDALGGLIGSLVIGPRWQYGLAEIVESAIAETNMRVRALPANGRGQPAVATLTAAALVGDWLCAVHVGNSRVYRFSGNELEQLTEDHAREPLALLTPPREDMLTINDTGRLASALGVSDASTPSVLFRRIAQGDVVLVCSDGLHEQVGGEELVRLLAASGSLDDMAISLVAAANARGGDDNISVCLARVGKLTTRMPEPETRGERLYGDVAATILPRYQAEVAPQWLPDRIGLVVGFLVSLVVLAGFVYWDDFRAQMAQRAKAAESVQAARDAEAGERAVQRAGAEPPGRTPEAPAADSTWTKGPDPAPAAPPAPTPVVAVAEPVVAEPPPAPKVPAARVADSIAAAKALKREAAEARVREVSDSLSEAHMAVAEQERRDSIALAVAAAAKVAEQRVRDSVATAEKRRQDSIAAQERVEAQARAAAQAEAARQEQERLRETRLASGRTALNGWLQRVVAAVTAGESKSAVLTAGPSGFATFVEKNGPKISDASITSVEVDESSGEATAEWVLKWRSNFGTATQRRVKASATVVRDGESWRLLGWKILEGEP